jgi:hypothetical protein
MPHHARIEDEQRRRLDIARLIGRPPLRARADESCGRQRGLAIVCSRFRNIKVTTFESVDSDAVNPQMRARDQGDRAR